MSSTRGSKPRARIDFLELKSRVTLLQVLAYYGWLRHLGYKQDGGLEGPCPLHAGSNPDPDSRSFKVTPSQRGFVCFGCQAKGSIIDLVAAREKVGYLEAARLIDGWFPVGDTPSEEKAPELGSVVSCDHPVLAQLLAGLSCFGSQEGLIGFFYDQSLRFRGQQILIDGQIGALDDFYVGYPESWMLLQARLHMKGAYIVLVLKKSTQVVEPPEREALRICARKKRRVEGIKVYLHGPEGLEELTF